MSCEKKPVVGDQFIDIKKNKPPVPARAPKIKNPKTVQKLGTVKKHKSR